MAGNATTFSLNCYVSGLTSGEKNLSKAVALSAPVEPRTSHALTSSFLSVSVPSGATYAVIVPPDSNTVAITLKGITGDTGTLLSLTAPTALALSASQTTVGLVSASAVTVIIDWY